MMRLGEIFSERRPVFAAAASAFAVAMAGGAATKIGPWYRGLEKSALNPPDWVFAPVWTIIYALCVIAAVIGWRAARGGRNRAFLITLFFFNAVFNIGWSLFFFTFQRPDWALAEVITLWISVAALIAFFSRYARTAAFLLAPYLAWVTFAAYLNYEVVRLNAPFG